MAIKDHIDLLNCLDPFEESPLKRFNNVQVLRMRCLMKGEIDDEEQKVVNALATGDLNLLRLGIEDKKANNDSEIAKILAEQLAKIPVVADRTVGTGTQPLLEDTSAIDGHIVTSDNMLSEDIVDIESLGLDL
jgi:hypothetical protein